MGQHNKDEFSGNFREFDWFLSLLNFSFDLSQHPYNALTKHMMYVSFKTSSAYQTCGDFTSRLIPNSVRGRVQKLKKCAGVSRDL